MNRFLLAALTFAVSGSAVYAQQAEPLELPAAPGRALQAPAPTLTSPFKPMAEEQGYIWFTVPYREDANRVDIPVPTTVGTTTIRGLGQIFAPKYFYQLFNSSVYNEGSNRIPLFNEDTLTDQDYIDQFKGAGAFTIEQLGYAAFKNPRMMNAETGEVTPSQYPTQFVVYKTTEDISSKRVQDTGFIVAKTQLQVVDTREIAPEGIDTTVNFDNSSVVRTVMSYDPPLEFANGESAVLMYESLEAPPVPIAISDTTTQEHQIALMFRGILPTGGLLKPGKSLGVALVPQTGGVMGIISMWRTLTFNAGTNPGPVNVDLDMTIIGTVDLTSGVRYHFGTEIGGQGVNAVSPNPVAADTRIPFTLTERGHVTLDLFRTGGQLVRNLVDESYIPGNYSAPLNVGDLENGVYIARMIVGTKVYTQKIIVNR